MCGIVGYAGRGRAAEELFGGLKRLEYRGYDSAGISTLFCGEIFTVKRAGRVQGLRQGLKTLRGCVGIGHTRWATHGVADDANAHPHVYGRFSVVHNGIIENYAELREELAVLGHVFCSQTDSEVIAHLLELYCEGDLVVAMKKTCARLRGCWAIAALCRDYEGFVVSRRSSPVILGKGEDCCLAASDVYALSGMADFYCIPEEDDIAVVSSDGIRIYDGALRPVERKYERLVGDAGDEGADDCPHYMLREIRQNARTIRATCEKFSGAARGDGLYRRLSSADKIILVGCGTAYNAALAGVRLLGWAYGCPVSAHIASEARYDPPRVTCRSVCVAVSQSGETADTIRAAQTAAEAGAYLIAMTNVGYSAITRIADLVVPVCAGAEVCVAATKSYIGQLCCLHLMASLRSPDVRRAELLKVAESVRAVASDGVRSLAIARICAESKAVFFLGRGWDVDVAVEGSLKLKEVSYIFSDGYPAGELKHGTLALVDEDVLSVVLICDEALAEKSKNAVEQILSRRGKVAVVTTLSAVAESFNGRADAVWLLPQVPSHLSHFVSSTALQLIAYRAAVLSGRDPDKPRNLAKSVTVE